MHYDTFNLIFSSWRGGDVPIAITERIVQIDIEATIRPIVGVTADQSKSRTTNPRNSINCT